MASVKQTEPSAKRESSPKHRGYGTDTIGGKGQKVFTSAVREVEMQGKEFHRMIDRPEGADKTNMEHPEHKDGHSERHFMHNPKDKKW